MTSDLEVQLADFASLGEVFDPGASFTAVAAELADVLMRQPLACGPLERIGRLTNLLRVLKLATRMVTAQRDRVAYSATAIWPYRRLSKLVEVNVSTMQGWITAGRKVVEPQDVSRETTSVNGKLNSAD